MVSEVRTLAPSSLQAIRRTRLPSLFCTTIPCDTRNQRRPCESSLAVEANLVLHLNPTNSFIRFILAFLGGSHVEAGGQLRLFLRSHALGFLRQGLVRICGAH